MRLDDTDLAQLRAIVADAVRSAVGELVKHYDQAGNRRLALTEAEAAGTLGLSPHQLRDARLRGEIRGSKLGRTVVYTQEQLATFVREQEI